MNKTQVNVETKNYSKIISLIMNIITVIFCIFVVFIAIIFINARNNRGTLSLLGNTYVLTEMFTYTVNTSGTATYDKGTIIAYEDVYDSGIIKVAQIEEITESKSAIQHISLVGKDGEITQYSVKGVVTKVTKSGFLYYISTQQGLIVCTAIPAAVIMIYYIVALIRGDL
jgi:hypothetical protein